MNSQIRRRCVFGVLCIGTKRSESTPWKAWSCYEIKSMGSVTARKPENVA
jgi:hypothetical protein